MRKLATIRTIGNLTPIAGAGFIECATIETTAIFKKISSVSEMQEYVDGESLNKGVISEGMVFKSTTNPCLSFKCINNRYLLKCEK